MYATAGLTLKCPVRGVLKASRRSKDGLTPTEEYFRVEAIRHLVNKGYPREHFKIEPIIRRFGHGGKNCFRSDFAVLDTPADAINTSEVDTLLAHALLLCEVKRDNAKADYVKETQVRPMLDFAKCERCLGLYWDSVEQRLFWQEQVDGKREVREGPLSFLPSFGAGVATTPLTFADTTPSDSLIDVFARIEDILHQAAIDPERRYEIILQLLLTKIFDEHAHEAQPGTALDIQDFSVLGTPPEIAKRNFTRVLARAVSYYEKHLPNKVPETLPLQGDALCEVLKILAPVRIIHSKRDVVQTFYMRFAKHLYRWELAQYFTPTNVTDFIVQLLNPQFGEHVCDPACGSADFLVAAFHIGRTFNPAYADCVWGVDNSANAVQIAVLNMLLNGDGKTNVVHGDSLVAVDKYDSKYDILVCNPPFGQRILEKRSAVLRKFDLGHVWSEEGARFEKQNKLLAAQETGLLFAEVCVRECRPGGRIAIILPNGYLGNRSPKYRVFREWLLRHARLAAVVSFPRFTFKTSGADVSASVVLLEKRLRPLAAAQEAEAYHFAVAMIERVGWEAGNKRAAPLYQRNHEDGSFLVDDDGEFMLDSDFAEAITAIRSSAAAADFPWLGGGQPRAAEAEGWAVPITAVLSDADRTIDPKRHCQKVAAVRAVCSSGPHLRLGDIVAFLPERHASDGRPVRLEPARVYQYVEIQDMGFGDFNTTELRGWELPSRAKHLAEEGDFYFGSIWGSVAKWCYIGAGHSDLVVTNGCHRCRLREGKEDLLLDLLAFANTEAWAVQLRACARGSDGLAEVTPQDAGDVIVPLVDGAARKGLEEAVAKLREGRTSIRATVTALSREQGYIADCAKRPSHIVLV